MWGQPPPAVSTWFLSPLTLSTSRGSSLAEPSIPQLACVILPPRALEPCSRTARRQVGLAHSSVASQSSPTLSLDARAPPQRQSSFRTRRAHRTAKYCEHPASLPASFPRT